MDAGYGQTRTETRSCSYLELDNRGQLRLGEAAEEDQPAASNIRDRKAQKAQKAQSSQYEHTYVDSDKTGLKVPIIFR